MSGTALPEYLAITPPSPDDTGAAWQRVVCAQLPGLARAWAGRVALQLRPLRPIPESAWREVLIEAAALNLPVWLNADASTIQALNKTGNKTGCGILGIHLNHPRLMAARCAEVTAMQAQGLRVSAACHDAETLARAEALGVDAGMISPVLPTASHPGAPVLGWAGFAALARRSALPVFGLGGLAPTDLPTLRVHGGYGVAGIGAFFPASLAESPK